ncbi:class I SAM-dependent RNA methyltransferase [Salana multivorans]|uniref:class I SAM-dependent RNA methyltransferase n=1 Tax=Salana multivorans TaxID=120377 RepID=UPI00248FE05D|nr:TRAM domain-containing protein [Salana multivorans]
MPSSPADPIQPTPSDDLLLREVRVGAPAHGGHVVARHDGRVVFVRHALPGELVDVELTEAGEDARFWRGDAVAVHEPSPDRVASAWPAAGPGGVGGGELAHATLSAQRAWKTRVLREALERFAGLTAEEIDAAGGAAVEAVPGDDETGGLGTRTRIELTADADGRPAMYRHRSHDLLALTDMPLAVEAIRDVLATEVVGRRWEPGARIDVVAPSGPDEGVAVYVDGTPRRGRTRVHEVVEVAGRTYDLQVEGTGFWQVHRGAPALLAGAVLDAARPAPGERVLELYAGAGLFTLPLADAVGPTGSVVAVEAPGPGARAARRNARAHRRVHLVAADVARAIADGRATPAGPPDVVVLDPPRAGAGRRVVESVTALDPRRIVYVACDPVALARDVALAGRAGYSLTSLRAFDLFPHTHHLEAVAVLDRS